MPPGSRRGHTAAATVERRLVESLSRRAPTLIVLLFGIAILLRVLLVAFSPTPFGYL